MEIEFLVMFSKGGFFGNKENMICDFCGSKGNVSEKCWKKFGYFYWYFLLKKYF